MPGRGIVYSYSVVIPTFNRMDILPEVLSGLEKQESAPLFEVLVVDDHSTDATAEFLDSFTPDYKFTVLRNSGRGPAAARNVGVRKAQGERIAFLGDDTVPASDWLFHHNQGAALETAVLGYTTWHPRMRLTPFLDWLNNEGKQFGYGLIEDLDYVPFNFFYTSNISLPRQHLLENPFDTRFPYPAWEDIELGYRLINQGGLKLQYRKAAQAWHYHPTDLKRFCERQRKAGESGVTFARIHPELASWLGCGNPPRPTSWIRSQVAWLVGYYCRFVPQGPPLAWEWLLGYHYRLGVAKGWLQEAEIRRPKTRK